MIYTGLYSPGDKVLVCVDNKKPAGFSSQNTGTTIEAMVLGVERGMLLLGFETKVNYNVWEILPGDLDSLQNIDLVPNRDKYHYAWWMDETTGFLINKSPAAVNSNGIDCKKCQLHYPYAVPNQPDGTLICYGCKLFSA